MVTAEAVSPGEGLEVELRWDHGEWQGTLMGLLLFVRERLGGGFPIPPIGWPEDGHMKGVILQDPGSAAGRIARVLLLRRGGLDPERFSIFRTRTLQIRADRPVPLILDGEYRRRWNPKIAVLPGALEVAGA